MHRCCDKRLSHSIETSESTVAHSCHQMTQGSQVFDFKYESVNICELPLRRVHKLK
jgi:hypothetical protein